MRICVLSCCFLNLVIKWTRLQWVKSHEAVQLFYTGHFDLDQLENCHVPRKILAVREDLRLPYDMFCNRPLAKRELSSFGSKWIWIDWWRWIDWLIGCRRHLGRRVAGLWMLLAPQWSDRLTRDLYKIGASCIRNENCSKIRKIVCLFLGGSIHNPCNLFGWRFTTLSGLTRWSWGCCFCTKVATWRARWCNTSQGFFQGAGLLKTWLWSHKLTNCLDVCCWMYHVQGKLEQQKSSSPFSDWLLAPFFFGFFCSARTCVSCWRSGRGTGVDTVHRKSRPMPWGIRWISVCFSPLGRSCFGRIHSKGGAHGEVQESLYLYHHM